MILLAQSFITWVTCTRKNMIALHNVKEYRKLILIRPAGCEDAKETFDSKVDMEGYSCHIEFLCFLFILFRLSSWQVCYQWFCSCNNIYNKYKSLCAGDSSYIFFSLTRGPGVSTVFINQSNFCSSKGWFLTPSLHQAAMIKWMKMVSWICLMVTLSWFGTCTSAGLHVNCSIAWQFRNDKDSW